MSVGPGISVVTPSFRGAGALRTTLASLEAQTLDPGRFESIVVVNGPASTDLDAITSLRCQFPALRLRLVTTKTAGASLAWNLGVQAARMEWLTFLDDDDTISPSYLEQLLALARPGVMPLARIDDVHPDGTVDSATALNGHIERFAGEEPKAGTLPQALGFNAAKLIPTRWAKAVAYDRQMTNGQDVAYFGTISQLHDVRFAVTPPDTEATYRRGLSGESMSRQESSFEFAIGDRLKVVEALDRARRARTLGKQLVADHLIEAQAFMMNRFLVSSRDFWEPAVAHLRASGIGGFPYHTLNRDLARHLVIVTDQPRTGSFRLRRLLKRQTAPIDLLEVTADADARESWVSGFWQNHESLRHLEGRTWTLPTPQSQDVTELTDAARRLMTSVDGSVRRYDVVSSLTRSGIARPLSVALAEGR